MREQEPDSPIAPDNVRKRKRRRAYAPAVLEEIRRLSDRGFIAKEIVAELDRKEELAALRKPSERTVQRMVADIRPDYAVAGVWRFGDRDPDEDRLILECLAAVVDRTDKRVRHITGDEADWIVRVRRARPKFGPWLAYRFARRYIEWRGRGESTELLDVQLARLNPIGEGMSDEELDRMAMEAAGAVNPKEADDGEAR